MKRLLFISVLLTSCVTTDNVNKYTDAELCRLLNPWIYVTGPAEKSVIREEIRERKISCIMGVENQNNGNSTTINKNTSNEEKLEELKDLFEKGLITEDVYKEAQNRILLEN